MDERKAAKSNLHTIADIQLALKEARHQAANGNISGADERVQQIKYLIQGQDIANAALTEKMTQVRELWLEALADLAPVFETQEAYREALAYTRILHGDDPSWEPDLRRLIHLYVLMSGSRADALAVLRRRFKAAVQGQGSLVLIRGVGGIGKTSLAQVCAGWARRQGAVFAMGRCYERGVTAPFSPWQEVLTSLAEATDITTLDTLPAPFGSGPSVQSAEELVQTVANHLLHLETEGPLVLLLDDLHWADQDTLNLLEYVTRRIESLPLLILVTYRLEEVSQDHPFFTFLPALQRDRPTEIISLTALKLDDTTRLIESHLGPCSPSLARYLHERAEGHPLFLIELLHDLKEQNLLLQDTQGRWLPPAQDTPVPTLLRQVIVQRVARLDHQGEPLLDVAAVAGETWELPVVESILNWPEESLLAALESALAARLVEADDERRERYRFSHGLIQEVLYQRQLPRRRRNLHGQIAGLLEVQLHQVGANEADRGEIVSALAYHAYRAEQWPRAFEYSQQAGDAAHQRYALHSVVHFYRQALDAAQQQGDAVAPNMLLNLYEKLGEAHYLLNQKEEEVDIYTQMVEAARTAKDKTAEVHALFRLALAQERMYDPDRSTQTRQAALELAEEVADPSLLALNHLSLSHHFITTGDLDQGQHHLVEAEQHARASDNSQVLVDSLRYQGYLAIFWGEYTRAERLAQNVLERVQATSNVPILVNACWLLGFALTEQGHYERARRFLLEGLDHVDVIGERHYYLNRVRNSLSYLHRELGDFETAARWSQRALAENRQSDAFYSYECACYSLLDLASNSLEAGDPEAAADYFREFEANFSRADYASYRYRNRGQLFRAELALAQGAHTRALEYATQAGELAKVQNMRKNVAKSLLYQGQALLGLERLEEAVTPLQQAVALADQIGHAALRWKTRLRLAEAHTVLNHPHEELYHEALTMVEAIADNLHDPQLHSSFLNLPLVMALQTKAQSAPETPKAEQYPAGLSPREVEVLRLVAQGYTDRQISEKLQITVRTVNTHVTNILNKTACENRTAAATFAAQNNLV